MHPTPIQPESDSDLGQIEHLVYLAAETETTIRGALAAVQCPVHLCPSGDHRGVIHAVTDESCRSILGAYDGRPDPGTPAAAYSNAFWHGHDWIAFALAGAAVGVLAYLSLRPLKSSSRLSWSSGLVLVLAIANAAVASSLRSDFGA
jgi:hypothetical protein